MTKLTRETALALMPDSAIQPIIWMMIMHTMSMMITAAQIFRPISNTVTTNTAPAMKEKFDEALLEATTAHKRAPHFLWLFYKPIHRQC